MIYSFALFLIHCLWGLQLTDVWHCSFSPGTEHRSVSLSCHHPDVCPALHSWSREKADRQTALQLCVCGLQSLAIKRLTGRHSQHQSRIISQASLRDPIHKIPGVVRRKQRRMTLLAQLLYSLWCAYEPWPAARPLQQCRGIWASQRIFDGQLPRYPLAKPKAFCMWHFFLFLSFWLYCATTVTILSPFQRLLWIETRIF